MNHPGAAQQGLPPPPHHLQHHRPAGLIQQHQPNSPHQPPSHIQTTQQASYASPHSSAHSLPQHHQSPYVGSVPTLGQQHPGESAFFGAHPSPYSAHSTAGSYASSETAENMATQAAIGRQQYPPISSYQTPQSNSPASIHSPQTDAHGRPMYAIPSMPQQIYYAPQYQMQQSPYGQNAPPTHHTPITSAPGTLMSYQHAQHAHPHAQMQQQQPPQHATQQQPGASDSKPSPASLQRPPSVIAPPHGTPQTPQGQSGGSGLPASAGANPSAAPGPIPATTPLVVRQDNNGVQWIAFEYSRDRVKMEYTIRCDVENVNTAELSQEFKSANCVYPRACCAKDQYKGNRLAYESECNTVGWALAQLNPPLREKRGLIQRAVDSWRNSNQDPRLRSRRVRRMAKLHNRKQTPQVGPGAAGQLPGPAGAMHNPPGMHPPPVRPPDLGAGGPPTHHHGNGVNANGEHINVGNEYSSAPVHHHQPPLHKQEEVASPDSATPRYAQTFYPTYPQQASIGSESMGHGTMGPMQPQVSTLAKAGVQDEDEEATENSRKRKLFGEVPESKRRKFILVEDGQRGTRVRVRVMLDQVKMDDMPDAHLKINAVYPRSYYPRQVGTEPGSPRALAQWDDEEDELADVAIARPKTMVKVPVMDGSEAELPLPRMTKSKRNKEIALNELGYRMSWGQARTFNGRTLFLQRSLDAYRNKMRSTMAAAGQDVVDVAPHFETRPGKRKWLEYSKRARRGEPEAERPESP